MSKTSFTPGPWRYDREDKLNPERAFGIVRDLGPEVSEQCGVECATETIAEIMAGQCDLEDARLIAAAPELLAALEETQDFVSALLRAVEGRRGMNENLADDVQRMTETYCTVIAKVNGE